MHARLALLIAAFLALGLLVAATPVPDAQLAKKGLKQYDARHAVDAGQRKRSPQSRCALTFF